MASSPEERRGGGSQGFMRKIAIIGSKGYVGGYMVKFFKDHYQVVEYDIDKGSREEVNTCDLAVVCVPTPMAKDGSCDTSIVEEVVSWIKVPIWIRSTVAVGTTDYLKKKYKKRIVFSPEYLGESTYYTGWGFHTDEKQCPWYIIGGEPEDRQYILDIIVPIAGPTKHYRQMTAKEAEVAKYMENIYFAMKVTFANEMYRACKKLGVNYWEARDGWGLDPRVDKWHTAVFPDKPGFGGKCLPKDLMGFIKSCQKVKYEPHFLGEIWNSNIRFRGE